ncbi:MAG TPA: TetR/AcrR family transcriptional regulator [Halanaerobiales bacterium]|nr:TetR/AcrR family transcriptional regulator [Halanaerobiales bacterium]
MSNGKISTKEKIIKETIQIMKKEKDFEKITMRNIAKKADVAVSMLNYHFQTKENLINRAVESYISDVIKNSEDRHREMELTSEQRMRSGINAAADFIANNPGVSRVSILSDLKKGSIDDNSSHIFQSIFNQLKRYFGDQKNEITLKILAQQQLAALQVIFLRTEVFKKQTGLDFFKEDDRREITKKIVDNILCES